MVHLRTLNTTSTPEAFLKSVVVSIGWPSEYSISRISWGSPQDFAPIETWNPKTAVAGCRMELGLKMSHIEIERQGPTDRAFSGP